MILKKKKQFNTNRRKWFANNTFLKRNMLESYAIIALESSYITKSQMEACRKIIVRIFRTQTKKPIMINSVNYLIAKTSKSKGTRMGNGKGSISAIVSKVKKYDFLFRFLNITKNCIKLILKQIQYKLPIKLELIFFNKTDDNYRN